MAEKKTTNKKLIQSIKKDLQSNNEATILDALKRVKSKGDATIVPILLDLYDKTESTTIATNIKNLISQLKITTALPDLIDGLAGGSDKLNEMILFSIWNANLNPVDFVGEVIEASCKGSYMVALEGLTVVENLEGPFSEETINDAKITLNEYFQQEDEKVDLIKSMLGFVRKFEESIIDD